jgi:hypothetical protein
MRVRPALSVSGANGEPDANSTRPPVHSIACSKVHSDWLVGLDSGKMMGRGLSSAISRTAASLNAPPIVLTPMSAVGLSARIADMRSGQKGTSWANGSLWCCSVGCRDLHTCARGRARGRGGAKK